LAVLSELPSIADVVFTNYLLKRELF